MDVLSLAHLPRHARVAARLPSQDGISREGFQVAAISNLSNCSEKSVRWGEDLLEPRQLKAECQHSALSYQGVQEGDGQPAGPSQLARQGEQAGTGQST